jgi:hypothetical protein
LTEQNPRAAFAAALTQLRHRIPVLSDEELARRASAFALPSGRRAPVNARRLGEWLNGQAVPRRFEPVLAVVLLIEKATGTSGSAASVERLWRAAQAQPARREALVLGRPPSDAAALRHRPELAKAIDDGLRDDTDRILLTGPGGVGKSQLAAAAFHRARERTEVLVWVPAATRQSVLSSYARAWRMKASTDAGTGWDDEAQADLFIAWLRSTSQSWLVVLDDIDDPAELSGLWPAGPSGKCVVTTRRRDAALIRPGTQVITVGMFTPEDASAYLSARLFDSSDEGLPALAAALGRFPLALSQAAAFLIDTGMSLPGYLRLLTDQREHVADLLPSSSPADEHGGTVVSTVQLALERAEALAPAGTVRAMIELVAMLAPDGIPESLLLGGDRSDLLALRALHRLSLVSHDGHVEVHAIVQRVIRDLVPDERRGPLALAAADAIERAWAAEENTALLFRNAEVLLATAGDHLWANGMHPMVRRLARYLASLGRAGAARDMAESLIGQAREDRDVLFLQAQVAAAIGDLGTPVEAMQSLAETGRAAAARLGDADVDTLRIRVLEAHYRMEAGMIEAAEADLARLVAASPLSITDLTMVDAIDDLALCQGLAGKAAAARETSAGLVRELKRELGPRHPSTLRALTGLGRWIGETGDAHAAVATFQEAVTGLEPTVGRLHHDMLVARHNLAYWQSIAGDLEPAIEQFVIGAREAELGLGADHPTTLTYQVNLAFWQGVAGNTPEALDTLGQLRKKIEAVFGTDHPRALRVRQQLADLTYRSGDRDAAVTQLDDLLAEMVTVQGANHPRTREAADLLAAWRGSADVGDGDPVER